MVLNLLRRRGSTQERAVGKKTEEVLDETACSTEASADPVVIEPSSSVLKNCNNKDAAKEVAANNTPPPASSMDPPVRKRYPVTIEVKGSSLKTANGIYKLDRSQQGLSLFTKAGFMDTLVGVSFWLHTNNSNARWFLSASNDNNGGRSYLYCARVNPVAPQFPPSKGWAKINGVPGTASLTLKVLKVEEAIIQPKEEEEEVLDVTSSSRKACNRDPMGIIEPTSSTLNCNMDIAKTAAELSAQDKKSQQLKEEAANDPLSEAVPPPPSIVDPSAAPPLVPVQEAVVPPEECSSTHLEEEEQQPEQMEATEAPHEPELQQQRRDVPFIPIENNTINAPEEEKTKRRKSAKKKKKDTASSSAKRRRSSSNRRKSGKIKRKSVLKQNHETADMNQCWANPEGQEAARLKEEGREAQRQYLRWQQYYSIQDYQQQFQRQRRERQQQQQQQLDTAKSTKQRKPIPQPTPSEEEVPEVRWSRSARKEEENQSSTATRLPSVQALRSKSIEKTGGKEIEQGTATTTNLTANKQPDKEEQKVQPLKVEKEIPTTAPKLGEAKPGAELRRTFTPPSKKQEEGDEEKATTPKTNNLSPLETTAESSSVPPQLPTSEAITATEAPAEHYIESSPIEAANSNAESPTESGVEWFSEGVRTRTAETPSLLDNKQSPKPDPKNVATEIQTPPAPHGVLSPKVTEDERTTNHKSTTSESLTTPYQSKPKLQATQEVSEMPEIMPTPPPQVMSSSLRDGQEQELLATLSAEVEDAEKGRYNDEADLRLTAPQLQEEELLATLSAEMEDPSKEEADDLLTEPLLLQTEEQAESQNKGVTETSPLETTTPSNCAAIQVKRKMSSAQEILQLPPVDDPPPPTEKKVQNVRSALSLVQSFYQKKGVQRQSSRGSMSIAPTINEDDEAEFDDDSSTSSDSSSDSDSSEDSTEQTPTARKSAAVESVRQTASRLTSSKLITQQFTGGRSVKDTVRMKQRSSALPMTTMGSSAREKSEVDDQRMTQAMPALGTSVRRGGYQAWRKSQQRRASSGATQRNPFHDPFEVEC